MAAPEQNSSEETLPAPTEPTALSVLMENPNKYPALAEVLRFYPPEAVDTLLLQPRQLGLLERKMKQMKRGLSARVPLVCFGSKCPYSTSCPLASMGIAPISNPCPIEAANIEMLTESLMEDLNIEMDNVIERVRLAEMIELMILDQRATMDLAQHHYIDFQAVGVDKDGNVIKRKEPSIGLELKLKLKPILRKYLEEFMSTREMRAKHGQAKRKDLASVMKDLHQRVHAEEVGADPEDQAAPSKEPTPPHYGSPKEYVVPQTVDFEEVTPEEPSND